ncbi:hypothetical protein JQS43_22160 [Natronosporangium hydrolyticum]|uniref:Uncharacterized protein n=1 Tax=Natronosporangium hydrolyticum TaxID=2811111 RepID=A0A895YA12_9ACTN|nr:hypothetical protein [Natronosporangium hydrolyticum]QSB14191.1 hypothetical protein JQS43_22160 [Natronosporangium hydrolyticum]
MIGEQAAGSGILDRVIYEGPATLIHGREASEIHVALWISDPGKQWAGTATFDSHAEAMRAFEVGNVGVRLPDGRSARAVLEGICAGGTAVELLGSGPPPR